MRRPLLASLLGGVALAAGLTAAPMMPARTATIPPPQRPGTAPPQAGTVDAALIARGKYLTDLGDCQACHSANGGAPFAGGQYMNMPFGNISTPNITPDVDTGIGKYTDADMIRVFHHGVNRAGENLYPAMPYPWYATVPDDDIKAIRAYLFSVAPVHAPRRPNQIYFPFTFRPGITLWNWLVVPDHVFAPDPKLTVSENRGAYIVNGLEHCGECHNNRLLLGNTSLAGRLLGGPIQVWYAPSLRPENQSGLGRFSRDEVVAFLRDGHSPHMGTVGGPMSETVDESLSKLTNSDLHAIVDYLYMQPPGATYVARQQVVPSASVVAGHSIYLSNCASCHQVDGMGVPGHIPALAGNGMVRAAGPQDIVQIVLGGMEARGPYAPMPGLGAGMTDKQIADVANYVRQAWGNGAPANTSAFLVSVARPNSGTLLNGGRGDGCPEVVQPDLAKAVADPSNGIDATLHATALPNMLQSVDKLVTELHAAAPGVSKADAVNGMTIAYCHVLYGDGALQTDDRLWQMTHFADRLYTQLTTNGAY